MTAPSPRYTLRQSPAGFWYMIPFIYEYGWSEWCKEWKKSYPHVQTLRPGTEAYSAARDRLAVPAYAAPIHDLQKLTFEYPLVNDVGGPT